MPSFHLRAHLAAQRGCTTHRGGLGAQGLQSSRSIHAGAGIVSNSGSETQTLGMGGDSVGRSELAGSGSSSRTSLTLSPCPPTGGQVARSRGLCKADSASSTSISVPTFADVGDGGGIMAHLFSDAELIPDFPRFPPHVWELHTRLEYGYTSWLQAKTTQTGYSFEPRKNIPLAALSSNELQNALLP